MPPKINTFWTVNLGHILVMLSMSGAALLFFLNYHDKIRDNADDIRTHKKEQNKFNDDISNRVKALESHESLLVSIDKMLSTFIAEQKQKERKYYAR